MPDFPLFRELPLPLPHCTHQPDTVDILLCDASGHYQHATMVHRHIGQLWTLLAIANCGAAGLLALGFLGGPGLAVTDVIAAVVLCASAIATFLLLQRHRRIHTWRETSQEVLLARVDALVGNVEPGPLLELLKRAKHHLFGVPLGKLNPDPAIFP